MDVTTLLKLIAVIISAATFVWGIYKYVDNKTTEQYWKEFSTYHQLIKDLVEPNEKGDIYIDRQAAILYELRNYPRYYFNTKRMLERLKVNANWKKNSTLVQEIDLTLGIIDKKWRRIAINLICKTLFIKY